MKEVVEREEKQKENGKIRRGKIFVCMYVCMYVKQDQDQARYEKGTLSRY